jgi:hypothetical protein
MSKRHPNRRQRAYQHLHAAFPLALPLADAAIRPLALASRDELAAWIRPPGAGRVRGPGTAARAAAPLQPADLSTGGGRWRDADRPPGRTGGSGDGSKRASGAASVIAIGPNQDDAITATTTLLPDPFILRRIHPRHPNRLASIAATASIPWTGKEFYSLSRPQAAVERPRRSRRPRRAGGCAASINSARASSKGAPATAWGGAPDSGNQPVRAEKRPALYCDGRTMLNG